MARFKRKFKWKNIISTTLLCVLLVGAVAGLGSILSKDTKTVPTTAFSVGAIDENGIYEASDLSIYTRGLIECDGLMIEPDFEATGTYQVFYYDSEKKFVEATEVMNAADGSYEIGETDSDITYARIMITPAIPLDKDGNEVENFKIRNYETVKYANDYRITVNKEQ